MGSISQAPSSPRSPHTHTHFQVFKPPIPRSSSWKSRPLVSLLCAHFLWLGLLWSQVDSMKRENAMEIASSAPHSLTPYTLFRPQFFWSERRIPLGILGAFPAATAIAAALSFNLSMRLAWGQGKRREKGRGGGEDFPYFVLKVPSFLLLRPGRQGFLEIFLPCPVHSSRSHTAFETRPGDTGTKNKTGSSPPDCLYSSSDSLPQTTCYHFVFRILREQLHSVQCF